jgi:hypothetical protein
MEQNPQEKMIVVELFMKCSSSYGNYGTVFARSSRWIAS